MAPRRSGGRLLPLVLALVAGASFWLLARLQVDSQRQGDALAVETTTIGASALAGRNVAYETLASWPVLPEDAHLIEGCLLIPRQSQSERGQFVALVFSYDPVMGARGLAFSSGPSSFAAAQDAEARQRLARAWSQSQYSSLDPEAVLSSLGMEVLVGTRRRATALPSDAQWFLLARRSAALDAALSTAAERSAVEHMTLGLVQLATSPDAAALLQLAVRAGGAAALNSKLVLGHMLWDRGQLEEEVALGALWPCAALEHMVLLPSYRSLYALLSSNSNRLSRTTEVCIAPLETG